MAGAVELVCYGSVSEGASVSVYGEAVHRIKSQIIGEQVLSVGGEEGAVQVGRLLRVFLFRNELHLQCSQSAVFIDGE